MTTLPLHATHVPAPTSVPGFGRLISAIALFLDALVEAHEMAVEAHKRYPFAAW